MYGSLRPEVEDASGLRAYHPGMSMSTAPSRPPGDPVIAVRLTPGPVATNPSPEYQDATGVSGGGACTFEGITRPETHPDHGTLVALRYEAAEPLTTRRMRTLAIDIAHRHGLRRIEVEHSTGTVPVGRTCVRIVTSADHRGAAFAACRETIDRLKVEIPIWKQECWTIGSTWSTTSSPLPEASNQGTHP